MAFSASTVHIDYYYSVLTNLAGLRLVGEQRQYLLLIAWLGLCGCVFLAAYVPIRIWLPGRDVIGLESA